MWWLEKVMWKKWWKYLHYNEHLVIPKTKIRRKFELNKARKNVFCSQVQNSIITRHLNIKYYSPASPRDDDNVSEWLVSSKEFKYIGKMR